MAQTKETEKKIEETISPEVKDNENQDNLEVNKADVENEENVENTENVETETATQSATQSDTETGTQTKETEKKNDKTLTVTENFKDKYGQVVIFQKDNTIVASKKVNGNEIVESGKGQYQVSVERYEELKNCPYVK